MTRDGVRREILDAIRAVLTRSGSDTFTSTEIVTEMTRKETRYAESTIRTMITGHHWWNDVTILSWPAG
jgi:hypothetical protein